MNPSWSITQPVNQQVQILIHVTILLPNIRFHLRQPDLSFTKIYAPVLYYLSLPFITVTEIY